MAALQTTIGMIYDCDQTLTAMAACPQAAEAGLGREACPQAAEVGLGREACPQAAVVWSRRNHAGFTMLEVVVVLSIMVLIIGLGFASFQTFDETSEFDEPAARLTEMGKFTLQAAMLRHRGMGIGFDEQGFGVIGEGGGPGARYQVPPAMKIKLRRWGGRDWEDAEGQVWQFGDQGICEPIKVRLESPNGVHEMTFHPLTGAPVLEL